MQQVQGKSLEKKQNRRMSFENESINKLIKHRKHESTDLINTKNIVFGDHPSFFPKKKKVCKNRCRTQGEEFLKEKIEILSKGTEKCSKKRKSKENYWDNQVKTVESSKGDDIFKSITRIKHRKKDSCTQDWTSSVFFHKKTKTKH